MLNSNFSPWPCFTEEEAKAVQKTLLSNKVNYWTGTECIKFEKEFATFTGAKYAVALANGTVALDLAFQAIGLSSGDEVIVTSRTFIATVSSIINAGGTPIFADVCPKTQNIDEKTISKVLSSKTKAIVCVHLSGWPCDMEPIAQLAKKHGLMVIEDCAQAHGAKYKGKSVGTFGDVAAWSFCQDKIMTTGGEGGMVTTNSEDLWSKMWSFKDHGKSWDAVYERTHPPGFRWLHDSFGTNWRMTEMQAAIGRIQLRQLPDWAKKRNNNARRIWDAAKGGGLFLTPALKCESCNQKCQFGDGCSHAAYKCYIFLKDNIQSREKIIDFINQRGVPCFHGTCSEVYLEKAFESTEFRPKQRLPVAKRLGETSIMFLCHPTLTKAEIDKTCSVIKQAIKLFSKT